MAIDPDDSQSPLSLELCHNYVEDVIFKLRPEGYGEAYPNWPGSVGLEVEMLPIYPQATGQKPALFPLQGEKGSVAASLREIVRGDPRTAAAAPGMTGWRLVEENKQPGSLPNLLSVQLDQKDYLTFEPGGQLEFSTYPYPCLSDAVRRLREVQQVVDTAVKNQGGVLIQIGANPWLKVEEIGLQVQKDRYQAMDRHFAAISAYGRRMMRQTCTVQVCLDFGPSESHLVQRYLASQLLAPFVAAIFAHSPWIDNQPAGLPGFRSVVWQHVDPSRCGFPALTDIVSQMSKQACVASYLDFALQARVVFIEQIREKNAYHVPQTPLVFKQWLQEGYRGTKPTMHDFQTHLSLLFPEVRPKGFIELRSVDCQARAWQVVPAAFYTGLLYEDKKLAQVLELLLPYVDELPVLMRQAAKGLEDARLAKVAKKLMQLAMEGFGGLPPCFRGEGSEKTLKVFAEHFTLRSRTPGDELLEGQSVGSNIDLKRFQTVQAQWLQMIEKG